MYGVENGEQFKIVEQKYFLTRYSQSVHWLSIHNIELTKILSLRNIR